MKERLLGFDARKMWLDTPEHAPFWVYGLFLIEVVR